MNDFEDFIEDAEKASRHQYLRRGCALGGLMEQLSPVELFQVQTALDRKELTSTAIEKVLKARVDPWRVPSAYTIGRHRRGACKCEET